MQLAVREDERPAGEGHLPLARRVVEQLLDALGRVSLAEFRAQDTQYDHDCRVGRELLYLAANDEWNRGTTEVVELDSADTVETTIHVNVDLDLIAHEAFRTKLDRYWVPLVLLPPPREEDRTPAARVSASPTVVDAAGAGVPVLPQTEVRRWVAAALAEILLNMAPAVPPGNGVPKPVVTREQRLWLSAALDRVLSDGEDAPREVPDAQLRGTGRAQAARQEVHALVRDYLALLAPDDGANPRRTRRALLVQRAARIIHALGNPTTVVVVGMTPSALPATFAVTLPARRLVRTDHPSPVAGWRGQQAHLDLDLMLPFASADREVVVKLPEGVSYARDAAGGIGVHAELEVRRPRYIGQLVELVEQIVAEPSPSPAVVQALSDVAHTRVEASREAFRHHRLTAAEAGRAAPETVVSVELDALDEALATHDPGRIRAAWTAAVHLRDDGRDAGRPPPNLYRVLECEAVGPHAVDVRTHAIEDPLVRDSPTRARVRLDVVVHDSAPVHAARYSGWMSLVIVSTVLLDTVLFKAGFNAEVLAGLLTLFAVIQAGRVEHPNRNTLHGLLSAAGSWLILASILPTVLLGVTLAFTGGDDSPAQALAGAALLAQLLLQVAMYVGPVSGRAPSGRRPRLLLQTEAIPDYARIDVVHSRWWASTTAGALLLGREAHGYVVWQRDADVSALLRPKPRIALPQNPAGIARRGWDLLGRMAGAGPLDGEPPGHEERGRPVVPAVGSAIASAAMRVVRPGEGPPNILALARSGTERHGLTFIVFREEPRQEWVDAIGARRVELEADQLTAREAPIGDVDVFVGMPFGRMGTLAEHPLATVLAVTRTHRRLVLDVQLPAPPPRDGARGRRWMRVRVGLRDGEVASLSTFLAALGTAVREECPPGLDLLVQVAPQTPPRRFAGAPAPDGPPGVLTAEELNVVSGVTKDPDAREWLVVALYGYGRSGLEADMLRWFAQQRPRLGLVGMTTALLHGTSVLFLLGHQLGGPDEGEDGPDQGGDGNGTASWSGPAEDGVTVLVHEWVTAAKLGTPPGLGRGALLRVHARATDRPGGFADLFDHLGRSLARVAGRTREDVTLPVWHVLADVADGRVASYRFTVQVPPALQVVGTWQRAEWAAAERTLRQVLATRLPDGTVVTESLDAVVSMRLIAAGSGEPVRVDPAPRHVDVRGGDTEPTYTESRSP